MTISAKTAFAAPPPAAPVVSGPGASSAAEDSNGFAEQFQCVQAGSPAERPVTPAVQVTSINPVRSSKLPACGDQPSGAAEGTDKTTEISRVAAFLFSVPVAAPTALPMEFHLLGNSLPPGQTTDGGGTLSAVQQDLSGAFAAQGITAQSEGAATQVPQPAVAFREQFPPPAAVPVPAVTPEPGSEPADLAFAARLKPGPAAPAQLALSPNSDSPVPRINAIAELRRTELDENTDPPAAPQSKNPAAQAFITSDGPASLAPADKPASPAAPEARVIVPAAPVKSTGPVRELSLQMGSQSQERVDVRMVERGGELHVAVRTGSADLTHGLREGISDLVNRLQETGFRADTWRPGHAAVTVNASSGPQQGATEFRDQGDSQSHPGWSQQQPRDQRDQHQSHRPSWVEELEGSLTPTGESLPGDNYGLFR